MDSPKTPNPVDIEVGSKIRARRLMLGLSQGKLAEGLGITFQQVQKYEKGKNRVGASRLQAISEILVVSPSFFFPEDNAGAMKSNDPDDIQAKAMADIFVTKESLTLNRSFLKIEDANTRRKIVEMVKTIAESGGNVG